MLSCPSIYYWFVFASIVIFIFWYVREHKLGHQLSELFLFYLKKKSAAQVKAVDISVSDSVSQVNLRQ